MFGAICSQEAPAAADDGSTAAELAPGVVESRPLLPLGATSLLLLVGSSWSKNLAAMRGTAVSGWSPGLLCSSEGPPGPHRSFSSNIKSISCILLLLHRP